MSNLTNEEKLALYEEAHRLLDRVNELLIKAFESHERAVVGSPDACRPEFEQHD